VSDPEVVVAGHVCLDVIPRFYGPAALEPGTLVEVGPATFSGGGSVANVGLALHKLGVGVRLTGSVGEDAFGAALRGVLEGSSADVALKVMEGAATSYTLVVNPPGTDRIFLHHAGCNDLYTADDVDFEAVAGAKVFHFGYPPLMRKLYEDGGARLGDLLGRAKVVGATVSLDTAMPDPHADSGRADWRGILGRALPHVDVFMPSLGEVHYMLRKEMYLPGAAPPDAALLRDLAEELLGAGAAVVGLKLGRHGLYLRTAGRERLGRTGRVALAAGWAGRELWAPVFESQVVGTTGAGDATIAGFLAGLLRGEGPERALELATAVGACSVEAPDAVSGVRPWEETVARIPGWAKAELPVPGGWRAQRGLLIGPGDGGTA